MLQQIGRSVASAAFAALALPWLAVPASALDINGFLREKGHGDVALSFSTESYDHFWRGTTKVPTPPFLGEVTNHSVSLWGAYGLTDDLTLVASFPYVDSEGDGTSNLSESGLQDLSVLALYRLGTVETSSVRSDFIAAVGGSTPLSGYEGDLPLSLGDETTDFQLRFVYLLRTGAFYWSQQVGYDLRGGDAPNDFPLYTEVGYTVGRTTFNAFFSKLMANGGTDIGEVGFTFPSNQEEYERLGGKVFVRLTDRFGLSLAGYQTLDGRNTGDSSGGSIGLDVSF